MPTGAAALGGYLVALYNFLLGAVGIIALMMLVYGGFRYMTSAENPAAMGDAKDIVYSAVIGLALALLSWLIISTINPELLFTAEPTLSPVGSGGGFSANLPPASCADKSHGGYENPDECRCLGYTELFPARRECTDVKSLYGWGGTCDELCERFVCPMYPYCCVKAELIAGTNTEEVSYSGELPPVKKGSPVFFDAMNNSFTCIPGDKIVRVGVQINRPWIDFGSFQSEWSEETEESSSCNWTDCDIAPPGLLGFECDSNDPWCNSGTGRFTADTDRISAGTHNPWLRICVEQIDGTCVIVDDKSMTLIIE